MKGINKNTTKRIPTIAAPNQNTMGWLLGVTSRKAMLRPNAIARIVVSVTIGTE